MNSGGGSPDKVTSVNDVPNWQKPYFQNYLRRADAVSQNFNNVYSGQRYAGLNRTQNDAIGQQTRMISGGNPMYEGAAGQLQHTINGGFLGSTPYLDANVRRAQGSVVDAYNNVTRPQIDAQASRSGSYGNSGVEAMRQRSASDLQENLGGIASQMYGDNYARERGFQQQAIGMAPEFSAARFNDLDRMMQLGGIQQANQQGQINADMQAFQDRANLGRNQLDILGGALGQQRGGTSTQTQPGANPMNGVLGGALAGWAALGPPGALGGGLLGLLGGR